MYVQTRGGRKNELKLDQLQSKNQPRIVLIGLSSKWKLNCKGLFSNEIVQLQNWKIKSVADWVASKSPTSSLTPFQAFSRSIDSPRAGRKLTQTGAPIPPVLVLSSFSACQYTHRPRRVTSVSPWEYYAPIFSSSSAVEFYFCQLEEGKLSAQVSGKISILTFTSESSHENSSPVDTVTIITDSFWMLFYGPKKIFHEFLFLSIIGGDSHEIFQAN